MVLAKVVAMIVLSKVVASAAVLTCQAVEANLLRRRKVVKDRCQSGIMPEATTGPPTNDAIELLDIQVHRARAIIQLLGRFLDVLTTRHVPLGDRIAERRGVGLAGKTALLPTTLSWYSSSWHPSITTAEATLLSNARSAD